MTTIIGIDNDLPIKSPLDRLDLDDTLSEKYDLEYNPHQKVLDNLQGGILKGHGRIHTALILLEFNLIRDNLNEITQRISAYAEKVTKTTDQLREIVNFKKNKISGDLFVNFYLSAAGYEVLGFSVNEENIDERWPDDERFRAGMRKSGVDLKDTEISDWDEGYRRHQKHQEEEISAIHAMISLAHDNVEELEAAVREVSDNLIKSSDQRKREEGIDLAEVLAIERGTVIKSKDGRPIEHFGFVDGISNPLFLAKDIRDQAKIYGLPVYELMLEKKTNKEVKVKLGWDNLKEKWVEMKSSNDEEWDNESENEWGNRWDNWKYCPFASLNLVLSPSGPQEYSFGSYLVFRKLEQNVKRFSIMTKRLADTLGVDSETAGGLAMGRLKNGTPVHQYGNANNNFNYDEDLAGTKCPFHAHARRVNQRKPEDREHLIVRRGVTYGGHSEGLDEQLDSLPTTGVGLLFMCFQSDIKKQFEYIQKQSNGANSQGKRQPLDGIIGQLSPRKLDPKTKWVPPREFAPTQEWPTNGKVANFDFQDVVTLKGGEYFFAPSITFLKTLS